MHSNIFVVKSFKEVPKKVELEEILDISSASNFLSEADYISEIDLEQQKKEIINILSDNYLMNNLKDNIFTINKAGVEKLAKNKVEHLKHLVESIGQEDFLEDGLTLYIIQKTIEDKFSDYIYSCNDHCIYPIDNFFFSKYKKNENRYYGIVQALDYHY